MTRHRIPSSTSEFVRRVQGEKSVPVSVFYNGLKDAKGGMVLDDAQERQNTLVGIVVGSAMELLVLEALRGRIQFPKGVNPAQYLCEKNVLDEEFLEALPAEEQIKLNRCFTQASDKSFAAVDSEAKNMLRVLRDRGVLNTSDALANRNEVEHYIRHSKSFTKVWDEYERELRHWRRYGVFEDAAPVPPYLNPEVQQNGFDFQHQPLDPRIKAFNDLLATLPSRHSGQVGRHGFIEISDPGAKLKISTMRKLMDKYHVLEADESAVDASMLKDINRISVSLSTSHLIQDFNGILKDRMRSLNGQNQDFFREEGWDVSKTGYMDRKTYVVLPSKGGNAYGVKGVVAEVILDTIPMKKAYKVSHHLYEAAREMEVDGKLDVSKLFPQSDDPQILRHAQEDRRKMNVLVARSRDHFQRAVVKEYGELSYKTSGEMIDAHDAGSFVRVYQDLHDVHRHMYVDAINQCPPDLRLEFLMTAARKEGRLNAGKRPEDPSWKRVLESSLVEQIRDIPSFFDYTNEAAKEAYHRSSSRTH